MYEAYFNLSGAPFKLSPDPKFFFGSRSHNKAMAYLHYGLKQAEGFIVITGPVGAGKTMVIGQLLDQLNRSNIVAAQLLTSNVEPEELLSHILSAFRIEPEGEGRTGQLEAFEDYLFDQLNRGRRVLLIMDEAQNLPHKTLEELRMLSNIDYDGTPLFQVFLVGQPEFRDRLLADNLEQLKQRVIASYHLENLSEAEIREYILHRLSVVGWREDPAFSDAAFRAIFEETGGRPRRINTLANRLMLYCALEKQHEVTSEIVQIVSAELHEEKLGSDGAKKVSLPPVRSVASNDAQKLDAKAPAEEEFAQTASGDVVVSIDSARSKPAADEPGLQAANAESSEDVKDSGLTAVRQSEGDDTVSVQEDIKTSPAQGEQKSESVFDRLRAKRETAAKADDRPKAATLNDVASAIAAASEGGPARAPENSDFDEAMPIQDGDVEIAQLTVGRTVEWRKSVTSSINNTRDELRQAHASTQRLRHSLKEMKKRRGESRDKVIASLARAESLLREIQDAWR